MNIFNVLKFSMSVDFYYQKFHTIGYTLDISGKGKQLDEKTYFVVHEYVYQLGSSMLSKIQHHYLLMR